MRKRLILIPIFFVAYIHSFSAQAAVPVDSSLEPQTEEKSNVLQEMGVVQKKAMKKRSRFLLSTYLSLDFSDGPYTNYSVHANPGYAISDFLEVYASVAPFYLVSPRNIVNIVHSIQGPNGQSYNIVAARPKYEFGAEVLWAPLYGKDSFGISSVVRSDSFLKLGVSQVKYDVTTGMSFKLGAGKTFFLTKSLGLRLTVDYDYIQTVINYDKQFSGLLLTELGMMFYF